jgi:hypothetical protein
MIASEGRRVDQYFESQPKPVAPGVLSLLKNRFDYLECMGCGRIIETLKLTQEAIEGWKFDLMGLRPSILGVAHATCPVCQELQNQFSKILRP